MTEFLMYLALSAFIGVFIMRYIFGTTQKLRETTVQTDRIATIYAALDALAHDIEQAPGNAQSWKTLNVNQLSWKSEDRQVNWHVDEGSLKRTSKKYSIKEQRWKRAVTHVALEQVISFECIPHAKETQLIAITVTLKGSQGKQGTYTCSRTIPVTFQESV